jgi:hypothetical protein
MLWKTRHGLGHFVPQLNSGLDESEQVGVDLVGVNDGHAVGVARIGFELGVL